MAGTLTATTIQNDTSSPPTFRNNSVEIGQLCRAWVNFGATGTINSSFNVSSITYSATGNYLVNFTTAMPNANYAYATICIKDNDTIGNGFSLQRLASGTKSTTQLRVQNMANITVAENSVMVFSS